MITSVALRRGSTFLCSSKEKWREKSPPYRRDPPPWFDIKVAGKGRRGANSPHTIRWCGAQTYAAQEEVDSPGDCGSGSFVGRDRRHGLLRMVRLKLCFEVHRLRVQPVHLGLGLYPDAARNILRVGAGAVKRNMGGRRLDGGAEDFIQRGVELCYSRDVEKLDDAFPPLAGYFIVPIICYYVVFYHAPELSRLHGPIYFLGSFVNTLDGLPSLIIRELTKPLFHYLSGAIADNGEMELGFPRETMLLRVRREILKFNELLCNRMEQGPGFLIQAVWFGFCKGAHPLVTVAFLLLRHYLFSDPVLVY